MRAAERDERKRIYAMIDELESLILAAQPVEAHATVKASVDNMRALVRSREVTGGQVRDLVEQARAVAFARDMGDHKQLIDLARSKMCPVTFERWMRANATNSTEGWLTVMAEFDEEIARAKKGEHVNMDGHRCDGHHHHHGG